MNYRGMTVVLGTLLFATLCASAAVKATIRIKVLDSETHSVVIDGSGIQRNCDQVNFDAYCNSSKSTVVTNTLLVQEGDQPPFRIACSIDTRWSRCAPLPKGETFDAKRDKHGLLVFYEDDNGKARSQLYRLVADDMPRQTVATAQPHSAPVASSPVTAPVVPAARVAAEPSAAAVPPPAPVPGSVKCNFTSTPAGAEITLDGKYVGSTPSEIAIGAGSHAVTFSLPGFIEWKRDLAAIAGSDLTVSAILQKQQ